VLYQVPIVILSGMDFSSSSLGVGKDNENCKGADWLIGMFIASVMHIVISFYLSFRVTNGTDITLRDNNRHSSYERISYLLCHDPIVAFYILVWLFFIAWLIVGSIWSKTNQMDNSDSIDRCGNEIETHVGYVLGLGWTYSILGPMVLSCLLCCACFSKRDYVASDAEFAALAARNNNNNNNNTTNPNSDIELANLSSPPNAPPPSTTATTTTTTTAGAKTSVHSSSDHNSSQYVNKTPRTYSVEGIPIDEVNNNRKSDVTEKQQQAPASSDTIPEVVAEEIPSPMLPHATAPRTNTLPTSAAEDTANDVINSVTNTIGGWFKGGSSKKDGPDTKATVY